MRDAEKFCGTCKWHELENIDDGWICVNAKSDYCTYWTGYKDTCDEWEARKK